MIEDVNPFVYSRPVPPEDVVDRDEEVAALLRSAVGGHYVRLYAPRKYGKTSLLTARAPRRRAQRGARRRYSSTCTACRRSRTSRCGSSAPTRSSSSGELRGARRGVPPAHRRRAVARRVRDQRAAPARPGARPAARAPRLLDLPLRLEASGGYRALRRLRRVPGHRPDRRPRRPAPQPHPAPGRGRLVRLRWLRAGADAAPVRDEGPAAVRLGGADAARPPGRRRPRGRTSRARFEASGAERRRGAQPAAASSPRATRSGRCSSPTGSGPRCAQGREATLDDWQAAHAAAMRELEPEFDAQWRGLDASEQKTLRAIVLGDGSPYRTVALRRLELTKDVVRRALPRLAATAEIEERETGGYAIVDPLFAAWVDRLNDRPGDDEAAQTEPGGSPTCPRTARSGRVPAPGRPRRAGTGTTGR